MGSIESAPPAINGKVNESPLNRADEVADVSLQSGKNIPHILYDTDLVVALKLCPGAHHPIYSPSR